MDRNVDPDNDSLIDDVSLSARRAWIEIHRDATLRLWACVALRKESVDRNFVALKAPEKPCQSLSARRAWIEIILPPVDTSSIRSLSARRAWIEILCLLTLSVRLLGRSPQGERG